MDPKHQNRSPRFWNSVIHHFKVDKVQTSRDTVSLVRLDLYCVYKFVVFSKGKYKNIARELGGLICQPYTCRKVNLARQTPYAALEDSTTGMLVRYFKIVS